MACSACLQRRLQLQQAAGLLKRGQVANATRLVGQVGSSLRRDTMAILQRGGRAPIKFR